MVELGLSEEHQIDNVEAFHVTQRTGVLLWGDECRQHKAGIEQVVTEYVADLGLSNNT